MKIGLIVDGQSEREALIALKSQIESVTSHVLLKPIKADIQPLATSGDIARAALPAIRLLSSKSVDLVIIALDRESREECPGAWAEEIRTKIGLSSPEVAVVIKDTTFENWVVSDPQALETSSNRFRLTENQRRSIAPNRSDQCDALHLLKTAAGGEYHKIRHSVAIMKRADIDRMAANSRSFRRFLRCLDHPAYRDQSRLPARGDRNSSD